MYAMTQQIADQIHARHSHAKIQELAKLRAHTLKLQHALMMMDAVQLLLRNSAYLIPRHIGFLSVADIGAMYNILSFGKLLNWPIKCQAVLQFFLHYFEHSHTINGF